MNYDRLYKQIRFFLEADKLKQVYRQNYLADGSRKENDAEHSWHLALMCLLLGEHAGDGKQLEMLRILKMILIHDIVEIDAGDTYCYDKEAAAAKSEKEQRAAERLFKLLPPDQEAEYRALWEEFEAKLTPEARFAAALDRLQPLTLNYASGGKSWQEHQISVSQVLERNCEIADGSPLLWEFARSMIDEAVKSKQLKS